MSKVISHTWEPQPADKSASLEVKWNPQPGSVPVSAPPTGCAWTCK